MAKNKKWTEEELAYLRKNYLQMTDSELSEQLDRTYYSITRKLSDLGLNRYLKLDSEEIRNLYVDKKLSMIKIAKILKVSTNSIFLRLKGLGVKRRKIIDYNLIKNLGKYSKKGCKNLKASETTKRLHREGKLKVWNKNLSGKEYLKHYKEGETWLIKKQKDKKIQKEFIEKALKTKKERGSMPKGENHFMYGKTKENSELARKSSERMKKGGALKARKANKSRPNKPEKIIINLIKQHNLNFIYVGDNKKWFKGKTQSFNPDFINEDENKIIEFFGNYWHKDTQEKDKERLKTHSKYGYKTLVIWEHELKNKEQIVNKIKNF